MRLYFVPEQEGTAPDGSPAIAPAFGGLAAPGAYTHLRGGFLCRLGDDAPHAELIALPGVTFLPFLTGASRTAGYDDTLGALTAAARTALATRLEARGVPMDGLARGDTVATVLRRLHRRIALRQMLRDAGLADLAALDTGDNFAQRIEALRARALDVDGLSAARPRELLAQLLPRVRGVRVRPWSGALRGGTFTDNFNGEGSDVDLTGHTPSGGTSWTRLSGSSGDIIVSAANSWMALRTGFFGANAVYRCDDQADPSQYVQFVNRNTPDRFYFVANRITDASNYIGVRNIVTNGLDLQKRAAGSFTQLGSDSAIAAGDGVRMECDGNNIEVFADTGGGFVSAIGPVTETFNNTETRQGVFGDGNSNADICDDYEAGVLGGAGGTVSGAIADEADAGETVAASAALRAALADTAEAAGATAARGDLRAVLADGVTAAGMVAGTAARAAAIADAVLAADAPAARAALQAAIADAAEGSDAALFRIVVRAELVDAAAAGDALAVRAQLAAQLVDAAGAGELAAAVAALHAALADGAEAGDTVVGVLPADLVAADRRTFAVPGRGRTIAASGGARIFVVPARRRTFEA